MDSSAWHWDRLHENPRFRPQYPHDHVVRFLITNRGRLEKPASYRFLDIGAGAGRHMKLAAELGFVPYGVDVSPVGLRHADQRLQEMGVPYGLAQASMLALPFVDGCFDVVLSFGVFYYGTADDMKHAINEARRVMVRGGRLFVVVRTTHDFRFGKGEEIGPNTFRLKIKDTHEYDTVQHFVDAADIEALFAGFSSVSFEKTETTFVNRSRLDSDWLITSEK
jgi:SAM-dependent methyltransferase